MKYFIALFLPSNYKKAIGQSNRDQLLNFHQKPCQNTASVTANLGGGHYGHLVLCLDLAGYNDRMGATFIAPYNLREYA